MNPNPRMNRKVALALLRAKQRAREILENYYQKKQAKGQPTGQPTPLEQAQPENPRLP